MFPHHSPQAISAPAPRGRPQIVAAAREHFLRDGFHRVTMDDLAAELGLSKKTLYASFRSKDDLLEAVLRDKFERVDATLTRIARLHPRDFAAGLRAMLAAMQHELDELKPPFVRDMRRKAPHIFQRLEHRRARLIDEHFGKLFRRGQRAGHVRRDVPAKLMIEALLAAIGGVMNPPKVEELGLSPAQVFSGVTELLLHGALLGKRRKR